MGIYNWDNGKRVDTRKSGRGRYEALIYPPPNGAVDSAEVSKLISSLEGKGYKLSPSVEYPIEHQITLSGIESKKQIKALHQLAKANDLDITDAGSGKYTIEGFSHGLVAEQAIKILHREGFTQKNGITLLHEAKTQPPVHRLHVQGITDEKGFLSNIEKQGWTQGPRHDEYDGMSTPRKAWTKMVESARKLTSVFFMLGDAQIIRSTAIDAQRLGIPLLKHKEVAEGLGFALGSSSVLAGELLSTPPTVDGTVARFADSFRSGEGYDFAKSEGFGPRGKGVGRGIERAKDYLRDNSVETLMLADLWSGTGMWRGRFSDIIATEETNGVRNVRLNPENGEQARDTRLKKNNRNSAFMYTTAAGIISFVPQNVKYMPAEDTEAPFIDYTGIGHSIRKVPVVGQIFALASDLTHTTVGNVLLYPARKIQDWLSRDPYKIGGNLFLAHNLNQVYYGVVNMRARMQDVDQFIHQFNNESQLLKDGKLTAPAKPDGHLNVNIADVKGELQSIFDLDDKVSYKRHITSYDEQLERNEKPSDRDTFLAIKAMNRQYLAELNEELRRDKSKFGGYATFLAGNLMLSFGGKGHVSQFNGLEQSVNPVAVVSRVADLMKSEGATDKASIHNAATYLYQDKALSGQGLGVDNYEQLLTAKLNGQTSVLEQSMLQGSVWQEVFAVRSKPQVEVDRGGANSVNAVQTNKNAHDPKPLEQGEAGLAVLSQSLQPSLGHSV